MNRLTNLYRRAAHDFAAGVARELRDEIRAVILYGSVARGNADATSDIDVLLITRHGDQIREKVITLADEVDFQNGYKTFLTSIYLTLEEVKRLGAERSPLIMDVLNEGIILYEDGSFSRARDEILAVTYHSLSNSGEQALTKWRQHLARMPSARSSARRGHSSSPSNSLSA